MNENSLDSDIKSKSENIETCFDLPEAEALILNQIKKSEKSPKVNMSFREKCKYITTNITVEPIVICYILPSVLSSIATQNINLEKACRVNLNYGNEICDALSNRQTSNYTHEEQMVQQLVAGMAGYRGIIMSGFSSLFILFLGSWSDRNGRRKPCMLIPFVGELLTAISMLLCTYFDRLPMEYSGYSDAFFLGITGGWFTAMMGFFSYIGDVSSVEQRTLRIGVLNLCFSLGVPLGMSFSGILLKKIGFYGVFSTTATLYFIGLVYGCFFVKEPVFEHKLESATCKKGIVADFFDKKHIIETFRVAFKKGAHQRRLRVLMLLVVLMVVVGPIHGEMSIMYLYTRFQFNWGEIEFSIFSTYGLITHLIGTMFSVGVFSHLLKMDDAIIGVMSTMSKILSSFVYAFAVTNWQFYLGPLIEILNGTSLIAMRSIASKLVESDELGKINSLFGLAEAFTPLIYVPIYTKMYTAMLTILPGAFFLVGSALTAPAVLIFLWMYKIHKSDNRRKALENEEKLIKEICGNEISKVA